MSLLAILKRALELQVQLAAHLADDHTVVDRAARVRLTEAARANAADFQKFIAGYRIEVTRRHPKKR